MSVPPEEATVVGPAALLQEQMKFAASRLRPRKELLLTEYLRVAGQPEGLRGPANSDAIAGRKPVGGKIFSGKKNTLGRAGFASTASYPVTFMPFPLLPASDEDPLAACVPE
jgi:hypothetical protein